MGQTTETMMGEKHSHTHTLTKPKNQKLVDTYLVDVDSCSAGARPVWSKGREGRGGEDGRGGRGGEDGRGGRRNIDRTEKRRREQCWTFEYV